MGRRSDIDWEKIEKDYRLGSISIADVAKKHGVALSGLKGKAKAKGWTRDLTAKPRRAYAELPDRIPGHVVIGGVDPDEFDASGFIYVIYLDSPERFYKIGMAKHFSGRFKQHQCASPFDLCVACAYFVPNMRDEERALHAAFADGNVRGEWFHLSHEDLERIGRRAVLV